jgi:Tol biopolymer transport system component
LSPFESGAPHWSPDGGLVAVASTLATPCCDVFPYSSVLVNPEDGSYHALPMQDPSVGTLCQVWAPGGGRLACDGENDNDASVNGVYSIRSSDGGDLKRITNAGGMIDIPIDYSPDGTRIVFGRTGPNHACTTASGLFVVGANGGIPNRITPPGWCDDDGSWSPDSHWIAFEHHGSLFVVRPDGSDLTKIPLALGSRAFAGDFSWSPDGRQLAFLLIVVTGPHQAYEGIAIANADGSNVRQLTISTSFDNTPDWGPRPLG